MISDSRLACPECGTEFGVQWIGQAADHLERCPGCGWAITAGAFHASFEHQDLLGTNARSAFVEFCEQYPVAGSYQERMLAIDRLVHAVHRTGNLAARNLIEGRPRQVLAVLDELSRS